MSKHDIEIPGLPEGWKPVAYKQPNKDVDWCLIEGKVTKTYNPNYEQLIVEKIQPRRIVLEETDDVRLPTLDEYANVDGSFIKCSNPDRWTSDHKIWRQVKETDLFLTKDNDKLSLSVEECKELYKQINERGIYFPKLADFLKAKS